MALLVLTALAHPLRGMSQQDRSAYLYWMLQSLPRAPQFEQWQQRTGELPPGLRLLHREFEVWQCMAVREKGEAVTIVFRRSLAVAVTWCVVSSAALGQGTLDPLNVAITLSGAVTVERGEKNTNFFIRSSSSDVLLSMMNEHAFSPAPNDSMSYQWAQRLARAPKISVVVGDVRDDMKTSTALNEVMMCFTDPAPERKGGEVSYLLQCVAWDMTKALKREGKQVVEMAVSIVAKTGDTADAYLGKPRPENSLVYVRLQN